MSLIEWFDRPGPRGRWPIVRRLVVVYALAWTALRAQYWRDSAHLAPTRWRPVGVVGWLGGPPPPVVIDVLVVATFVVGAITLGSSRWAAVAFAAGFVYLTTFGASWGQILHTENLPALHLLIVAAAPPGRDRADATGWPLRAMTAVTVTTYVMAGVAKFRFGGGLDWLTGDRLLRLVANDNVRKLLLGDRSSPIAPWLVGHAWFFRASAVITMAVELGAAMALWGGRLRQVWVGAAWVFHVGVLAVMAVLFPYPLSGVAFASMLPVESLVVRARAVFGHARTPRREGRRTADAPPTAVSTLRLREMTHGDPSAGGVRAARASVSDEEHVGER